LRTHKADKGCVCAGYEGFLTFFTLDFVHLYMISQELSTGLSTDKSYCKKYDLSWSGGKWREVEY
jgi:hypothetical protein